MMPTQMETVEEEEEEEEEEEGEEEGEEEEEEEKEVEEEEVGGYDVTSVTSVGLEGMGAVSVMGGRSTTNKTHH